MAPYFEIERTRGWKYSCRGLQEGVTVEGNLNGAQLKVEVANTDVVRINGATAYRREGVLLFDQEDGIFGRRRGIAWVPEEEGRKLRGYEISAQRDGIKSRHRQAWTVLYRQTEKQAKLLASK